MWTRVNPLLIGALCLLSMGTVLAQEPGKKEAPQTTSSEKEEIPSILFLEFLGEFETEDGEWTDPDDLEEMELGDSGKKENEEK